MNTPDFPPLLTAYRLREKENALAAASRDAMRAGAGSLFYVGRYDIMEFALVLEPNEPLISARRVLFSGMNALADALSSISPPEKPLHFIYPDAVLFDGALVGGLRLTAPAEAVDERVPDFLILSGMLRMAAVAESQYGVTRESASLEAEGFDDVGSEFLLASFCRHFLTELDEIEEKGFKPSARRYLDRLPKKEGEGMRGLDGNGDLLIHSQKNQAAENEVLQGAQRVALAPYLAKPEWYDETRDELKW